MLQFGVTEPVSVYSRVVWLAGQCLRKGERGSSTPGKSQPVKEQFESEAVQIKDRMPHNDYVSVTIVTYNSGRFIKRCLESVLEQKYDRKEIIVIDNASTDGTVDILEQFEGLLPHRLQLGESGICRRSEPGDRSREGIMDSYAESRRAPAAELHSGRSWRPGRLDPGIGTVCGKLLTIKATMELPDQPLVDSTGIYFTPMMRHLDRGSQQVDNGHYRHNEYVFGATAAAALYRQRDDRRCVDKR